MGQNLISNDDVVIAANEPIVHGAVVDDSAGDIILRTGGVERARIDKSGVGTGLLTGSLPVFNVKQAPYNAAGDGVTDDTAAINAAIAALTAAGGGTLYFPAGVYKTSGGHTVSVPCIVCGAGRGSSGAGNYGSVVQLASAANQTLLTVSAKFVTVRDLGLEGNYANQSSTSHGVSLSANAAYGVLDNLYINSFHDDGIVFAGSGTTGWHVTKIEMRANQGHGINVLALAVDNDFYSINIGTSGLSGVKLAAADNTFTQLHTWGNGTVGAASDKEGAALITGASSCRFVNSYFETNVESGARLVNSNIRGVVFAGCHFWKNTGQGVYAFGAVNAVFSGCAFWDNGQGAGGGDVGRSGLVNDSGSYWAVSGNVFYDDQGTKTQAYGYYEANTPDHNTVIGNTMAASQHRLGSAVILGANNTPAAASIGTYNQV